MSGEALQKAASIPVVTVALDATGAKGVLHRATLTSSTQSFVVPAGAKGKWLRVFSASSPVQLGVSETGSAITLLYDQDVNAGTGHAQAAPTYPAGQICDVGVIPDAATHLSFIGPSGASGKVEFYVAEAPQV